MRFLVDECTGSTVAAWLREHGHDVFSVYDEARGTDDDEVLRKAFDENWILITNDKDFGDKVYRERRPHRGVVVLRLRDERAARKVATLQRLLDEHADRIPDCFVVATEHQVRIARREDETPPEPGSPP
jgi:predicted nuclease of predicted toxin-antitoxin system